MHDSRNNNYRTKKTQITPPAVIFNQSEIERLVGRAAGGDSEAFGDLYSIYVDRIYVYVCHQCNDKMTAEDITEDVFVKAWNSIKSCKGKEQKFLPWLFRIAHNHIIDVYRRNHKELSLGKGVEIEAVADIRNDILAIEKRQERQQLLSIIDCLPANQKQVIILKFIEGLDNSEIGQIMDKKEGAIRVMQMRALATLRQRIQKRSIDED